MLIILAANSRPVDLWTHFRTIEKAPLWFGEVGSDDLVSGLMSGMSKMIGMIRVSVMSRVIGTSGRGRLE